MAELVAGAIALSFPVMVYSLPSEREQQKEPQKFATPENTSAAPAPEDRSLISGSFQEILETSQRYIHAFSDEVLSDVSELSFRKKLYPSNGETIVNNSEPSWFRNVVQGGDLQSQDQSIPHDPVEYPWNVTETRYN
jgi:hypothetical protein